MATFDLTTLYYATVGFDRVSRLLSEALERENAGFQSMSRAGRRRAPSADQGSADFRQ